MMNYIIQLEEISSEENPIETNNEIYCLDGEDIKQRKFN